MAGAPQLNAAQHPRVIQAASCVAEVVTALATPPPPPPPPTATTSNAQPGAVNNTAPAQGAPAATSSGVAAAAVFELATADARLEALGSLLQAAGAALSRRLQAGAMVNGDAIPLPPGEAATSCVASALFGALVDASAARAAGGSCAVVRGGRGRAGRAGRAREACEDCRGGEVGVRRAVCAGS